MEAETESFSFDQEQSESSTSSTLAEILQLVQRQSIEIAFLKEQLGKVPTNVNVIAKMRKKVLGVCKKGDMIGRIFSCFKNEDGKIQDVVYLDASIPLKEVAKKVNGVKELSDGKQKKWSSWKDLENGEFVLGTYREKIV